MGEVGGTCVHKTGNGRKSNVSGAEEITGKFHIMRRGSGTIIPKAAHGELAWNMRPPYKRG